MACLVEGSTSLGIDFEIKSLEAHIQFAVSAVLVLVVEGVGSQFPVPAITLATCCLAFLP